jgi:hypothetical protein
MGGEMQKKKERGKLESVVGHDYLMHAANWTRVENTRGQLDACRIYTRPIGRVNLLYVATCFSYATCHVVIKTRG